jgi:hypothetical protein
MRRWHTGHSIGVGAIVGLLVAQHAVLVWLLGVLMGAGGVLVALGGWRLTRTLLAAFEVWRLRSSKARGERIPDRPQPQYDIRH